MKKIVFELKNEADEKMKIQIDNPKQDLTTKEASDAAESIKNAGIFFIKGKPASAVESVYTIEEIKETII